MFSPLVELNYYKTLSDGNGATSFTGLDFGNFGGGADEDEDALSIGVGGEARLLRDLAARIPYETPLFFVSHLGRAD